CARSQGWDSASPEFLRVIYGSFRLTTTQWPFTNLRTTTSGSSSSSAFSSTLRVIARTFGFCCTRRGAVLIVGCSTGVSIDTMVDDGTTAGPGALMLGVSLAETPSVGLLPLRMAKPITITPHNSA